ncbi:MAG: VanZ family protein [Luteolibacter sp.]
MLRVPRRPVFWLCASIVWFCVLFYLSSETHPGAIFPPIPNIDKFEHFGYFFGGAGLFSAYLFWRNPPGARWRIIIPVVILTMAAVGRLDEYHQGFVPGRSGNDNSDWLADILGAAAGTLVFKMIHRRLKWDS